MQCDCGQFGLAAIHLQLLLEQIYGKLPFAAGKSDANGANFPAGNNEVRGFLVRALLRAKSK